ncbi:acidic mammalian chitinase-like [Amphiura filiformis]|uniref:acidic mammalian chitinase-like n=1 Tax=Amphiura filiformis TaxID=82378 RepID=UPI003B214932
MAEHMMELRAAYEADAVATGNPRLLLTAAVATGLGNMDAAYEIPQISQSLDFINLMTYDLRGAFEHFSFYPIIEPNMTFHHTTTRPSPEDTVDVQRFTVEWAANEWLKRGCPKDKLVLGLGAYGHTFTLVDSNQNGINAPASGPGSSAYYTGTEGAWSYYEVCEKLNSGFKTSYDPVRQVVYAYSTTEWVAYDDLKSIYDKVS